jgi:hypothetical protein
MEGNTRRLDTTLGDLIAAASEVAFEYSDNDKEAYELAQLALIEILKKASYPSEINAEYDEQAPRKQILH